MLSTEASDGPVPVLQAVICREQSSEQQRYLGIFWRLLEVESPWLQSYQIQFWGYKRQSMLALEINENP